MAFFVHSPSGMRSMKVALAVLLASPAGALAAMGCSSSGESTFGADPDAAPEGAAGDSAVFVTDSGDASLDVATTCAPVLPPGFTPAWKAPGVNQRSCQTADLTGYAAACLGQPYDPNKCAAFKTANATCAACVESDATAAQLGPVVWHASRAYFTLNIAGCIAIVAKDTATGAGCAGAYQAVLTCKELSCEGCFSIAQPSFDKFSACEKTAGTSVCGSYGTTESTRCNTVHDPDAATNACFPTGTEDIIALFLKIAPLFCGP